LQALPSCGTETQGVVICNHPQTIDMTAGAGRCVESVPREVMGEVLARVQAVFED
jgi:mRNA interferase ChpB